MFIYEKNKRNSETGKLEQTLNITFEGNKPVENPDVVIDKDGVTGIKSDSNAYLVYDKSGGDVTEIKVDGEINGYVAGIFRRYLTWNTSTMNAEIYLVKKDGNTIDCNSDYFDNITAGIGEFAIDMENLTLTTPKGTTVPFSTAFPEMPDIEQIYGIQLGY